MWLYAALAVGVILLLVAIYDLTQRSSSVLRNFPIIGHFRYWLIKIGPELRQYIVAHNREEAPFNRLERDWIYHSADRTNNYFGFGSDDQLYGVGYPVIKHEVFPPSDASGIGNSRDGTQIECAKVIGERHGRDRPYRPPSVINISAMSFGSLGANAVKALNLGALEAGCYHNTGEGGISVHHKQGADLCYQIGTGYFGARDADGNFSMDALLETVEDAPQVKMIEIKLSQGAKPGKGGVLPGAKVTEEIAEARGVPVGETVISPSRHSAFHGPDELIDFVEEIAAETGLPVGIKSAVGRTGFFSELAERMARDGRGPDFITIDGGEGGTGAAPLTFADHVSLPYKIGFSRVYKVFAEAGIAHELVWIGSGKLGFPDRAIVAFAMGADLIAVAREAMLSIGCIQALKCHTGHCPTGVTTHNKWLQRGLVPEKNADRFAGYIDAFRGELLAVTRACGYSHPGEFTLEDCEVSSGPNQFSTLAEVLGYEKRPVVPRESSSGA